MRPTASEQLSFTDLEYQRDENKRDELLDTISRFLDDLPHAVDLIRDDLLAGLKDPRRGRKGLGPDSVLRSLILWRVKDLPYRELRSLIADGYQVRRFVRLRDRHVPGHDAFQRAFHRIRPDTLKEIADLVTAAACDAGLEDGSRVRVDGTVVEANIHFPTDASLMWDVVRVVTRLVKRLGEEAPSLVEGFSNRTRRVKRLFFLIQRPSRKRGKPRMETRYREMIQITEGVVEAAAKAAASAEGASVPVSPPALLHIEALRQEIRRNVALGRTVVDQARRRVLEDEKVPAEEKIVSIFEPHTDIIVRNKKNKPVEFGHKVHLAESATGVIFHHDVPDGAPSEKPWVPETLDRHAELFSDPPEVFASDRASTAG